MERGKQINANLYIIGGGESKWFGVYIKKLKHS